MAIAVVLVVLALGSVLFHFLSPWYFTPIASNWHAIDQTISITFWVTGFVFVAVGLFTAWCVVRYRHREGGRARYEPESKKLEWWLLILTAAGVAAMLAPGLLVWAKVIHVPEEAQVVEAVAQQWHWSYRLPGKDGKLGTVHPRFVTDANPFGLNPGDPNGRDDVLVASPELHLPLGKPVKLLLRSKDVLHDFTIAQLRVKMDLVPGLVTYTWFIPTRTGSFDLLCEELCGIGHYAMRGRLVVEEPAVYQAWLDRQTTVAQASARVPGNPAAGKVAYAVCAACHGANGEGNVAMNAPKLSGQGAWYLDRQLHLFKQGVRGTQDKDVYGKTMAPMAATLADDAAVANVVAYIASLPDAPAATTIRGDVDSGRRRFATCAACHGADGGGIAATNAPRLKGMSDWYMARQLKNFRDGVRGHHPQDIYGGQMALIAGMLNDDAAVGDVLAHINTLAPGNGEPR
ncbi:c-type cytochrome [Ramlibacter ginsenosidimutans]|uniref:cytochrome-c oxidase n=1 Tax=Ramlibacter ginsenosidimutans TaxID=502333 RepID=A0A934WP85_9BURK|nr:c-type cytochrome [Ramlibacter ginsenosidimutans]MBK6008421.1 c-type cytochrome [Ramlibacter ginsenosidimutans]